MSWQRLGWLRRCFFLCQVNRTFSEISRLKWKLGDIRHVITSFSPDPSTQKYQEKICNILTGKSLDVKKLYNHKSHLQSQHRGSPCLSVSHVASYGLRIQVRTAVNLGFCFSLEEKHRGWPLRVRDLDKHPGEGSGPLVAFFAPELTVVPNKGAQFESC